MQIRRSRSVTFFDISFLQVPQMVKMNNFIGHYLQGGIFRKNSVVSIYMSSDHRDRSTIRFYFHLNDQTSLYRWLYLNMTRKHYNKYRFRVPKHFQNKSRTLMLITLTLNWFLLVWLFILRKLEKLK